MRHRSAIIILSGFLWITTNLSFPSTSSSSEEILWEEWQVLRTRIQQGIDSIIRTSSYARSSKLSLQIRSLYHNVILYEKNANQLMTPASLNKLPITTAAFYLLGSNFRIPTFVYGDVNIQEDNGIYTGNIYLIGSGDPFLTVEDIASLANQIRKHGIQEIQGNVYVDDFFFDSVTQRQDYSYDGEIVQATPPITALSVNRNTFTITIHGAQKAGVAPAVSIDPPTPNVRIINKAVTSSRQYRSSAIKLRVSTAAGGQQTITIYGRITRRRLVQKSVFIEDPPLVAGELLKHQLEKLGITVQGKVERKKASRITAFLAAVYRPLSNVIEKINRESDNYAAEHLFKMLGAYVTSVSEYHTAKKARSFLQHFFYEHQLSCTVCSIRDGSGLSRNNRLTVDFINNLLVWAIHKPFAPAFLNSLSVAGYYGTLKKRLTHSPAKGHVYAKTGTLRNVSGLAGYIITKQQWILTFALLWEGRYVSHYKRLEDAIVEFLYGIEIPQQLQQTISVEDQDIGSTSPLFSLFPPLSDTSSSSFGN